jgi:large subunit ribosomal protein L17
VVVMRKRINYRQLGRDSEHRWAMLRNMVTSLIKHERIMTTTARAKELRRVAEKLVTKAKKNTLHNRRNAAKVVRESPALVKLFEVLGPRYQ